MTDIQAKLFTMADADYRAFQSKLIPNIDPALVIGVRTPRLRGYARELSKTRAATDFLASLPHKYYEENNLHAFLIEGIRDFDAALAETERFLPYIDNWATCDMFSPKAFKREPERLLSGIYRWLGSGETYIVRYAIGRLMSLFLDERFSPEYMEAVASVKSDEYYVNMMIAWYFATALAKQYNAAIPYLTDRRLPAWTHNKAIQKAVESSRIDARTKEFLRGLRI